MLTDCRRCDGCGQIADSDDGEPWTAWTSLPPGSDAAVRMGLVKPIPCPDCDGSGKVAEDAPPLDPPIGPVMASYPDQDGDPVRYGTGG